MNSSKNKLNSKISICLRFAYFAETENIVNKDKN